MEWGVVFPFFLVLLAFIPAGIGQKKGYSRLGFFLFGLLFFFPALIVALLVADKTPQVLPAQPFTAPLPADRIEWSQGGNTLLLGRSFTEPPYYGIWNRASQGPPVQTFPLTSEGYAQAVKRFIELDPSGVPIPVPDLPAPPPLKTE